MAKARCPDCDTLQGISPTGELIDPKWSARWWRVDMHPHNGKICDGSGKKV